MAGKHSDDFLGKLKSYSNSESFSDVVIRYQNTEFKAHTVILSCHSEYFAKQLAGSWGESIQKAIHITDFDSNVIEAMLHFIYHFEYTNEGKEPTMVFHAKVYQIADKYGIFALKDHAKQKFSTAVKAEWSTEDFPITIEIVYTTTPSADRGLRDLVVETSSATLQKLISRDGFCQALRTTTDFAVDLVSFTCGKMSGEIRCYQCPYCGKKIQFEDPKGQYRHCPRCGRGHAGWGSCIQVDE